MQLFPKTGIIFVIVFAETVTPFRPESHQRHCYGEDGLSNKGIA
jgi:hypothetical protein